MSGDLMPMYRAMAATGEHFRGCTILAHREQIAALVRKHKAVTLLDYGCGAGEAWKQPHRLHRDLGLRWFDVKLYDPAFPEHQEKPHGKHDGVLCSDVLEHVPEPDVPALVGALFTHARKFVWASVCCRPAKKTFTGTDVNLHVTIKPLEWWKAVFEDQCDGLPYTLVETP